MTWARLDDHMDEHPKVQRVGPLGLYLQVRAILYAARNLTDGFVPEAKARELAFAATAVGGDVGDLIAAMVREGLWEPVAGGYRVHDYLEYNPSRAEVLAERALRQTRRDLYNDPALVRRVRERDGDRCRYCGIVVRWNDRKGPAGGTYDHVVPSAGNCEENVVVACRGCNARKGLRTPEEAGMALRPPPADIHRKSTGNPPAIHPESTRKSTVPDPDPDPVDPPEGASLPRTKGSAAANAAAAARRTTAAKSHKAERIAAILDALQARGIPRPLVTQIEANQALCLAQVGTPEEIAECWDDVASGRWGTDVDRANLSFSYLVRNNRFLNWKTAKEKGHVRHATRGRDPHRDRRLTLDPDEIAAANERFFARGGGPAGEGGGGASPGWS